MGLRLARAHESSLRATDYKEDAFDLYISGLQFFLLRAYALKATIYVSSMAFITWVNRVCDVAHFILRQLSATNCQAVAVKRSFQPAWQ